MAKDGKKKAKIPKQVAGIKVPKKLRKAGNKAVKLAQDPIVGEVVAAALLSAAAALREGTGPKDAPGAAAKESVEGARQQAGALGDSLKSLALDLARRTLEGIEDGRRAARAEKTVSPGQKPNEA
jgi:hypothetical protein